MLKDQVPWQALSGDEGNKDDMIMPITKLPWRAAQIRNWAQFLDDYALAERFHNGKQRTLGRLPILRYDPELEDPPRVLNERHYTQAPKGLPENFYDAAFLQDHRGDLEVAPMVDLSIPDILLRCVLSRSPTSLLSHCGT